MVILKSPEKTKKKAWHWDEVHQIAFDNVKATITRDVVLAYPDYLKEFEIYTDALSKQLGAVITQGNKPIAFSSRKLTKMQQRYSVTKIERVQRHAVGTKVKGFHRP